MGTGWHEIRDSAQAIMVKAPAKRHIVRIQIRQHITRDWLISVLVRIMAAANNPTDMKIRNPKNG